MPTYPPAFAAQLPRVVRGLAPSTGAPLPTGNQPSPSAVDLAQRLLFTNQGADTGDGTPSLSAATRVDIPDAYANIPLPSYRALMAVPDINAKYPIPAYDFAPEEEARRRAARIGLIGSGLAALFGAGPEAMSAALSAEQQNGQQAAELLRQKYAQNIDLLTRQRQGALDAYTLGSNADAAYNKNVGAAFDDRIKQAAGTQGRYNKEAELGQRGEFFRQALPIKQTNALTSAYNANTGARKADNYERSVTSVSAKNIFDELSRITDPQQQLIARQSRYETLRGIDPETAEQIRPQYDAQGRYIPVPTATPIQTAKMGIDASFARQEDAQEFARWKQENDQTFRAGEAQKNRDFQAQMQALRKRDALEIDAAKAARNGKDLDSILNGKIESVGTQMSRLRENQRVATQAMTKAYSVINTNVGKLPEPERIANYQAISSAEAQIRDAETQYKVLEQYQNELRLKVGKAPLPSAPPSGQVPNSRLYPNGQGLTPPPGGTPNPIQQPYTPSDEAVRRARAAAASGAAPGGVNVNLQRPAPPSGRATVTQRQPATQPKGKDYSQMSEEQLGRLSPAEKAAARKQIKAALAKRLGG